jgi:IS605 OrfB family transposase
MAMKKKKNATRKDTLSFTANTLLSDFSSVGTKASLFDILDDVAALYGRIKRSLFKDCARSGTAAMHFKNGYLLKYGITARQFNAIRYDLDGTIRSVMELNQLRASELAEKIKCARRWIANKKSRIRNISADPTLSGYEKRKQIQQLKFIIGNKEQRLTSLEKKLSDLERNCKNGKVRICFGSNRLFRKQFALKENGYQSHNEWLLDWKKSRNNTFFCLGSKDETGGNQTCTLTADGTLRLRVPNILTKKYGHHIVIPAVRFPYGQEQIDLAVKSGTAISHRFTRGRKGWYLHTTIDLPKATLVTRKVKEVGAVSVDINEKEIAVAETDRFGNYRDSMTYPACVRDLSTDQTIALYADICKKIVARAGEAGKPIVLEDLDFARKKAILREQGASYSRMLSGFAYSTSISLLKRRAAKEGVFAREVNPAFTSVIGKTNYMNRYGITPHEAAAVAIARRAQGFSERPDRSRTMGPLPARNRGKHVWSFWRRLSTCRGGNSRTGQRRSFQDSSGCVPIQQKFLVAAQSLQPPLALPESVQSCMRPRLVNPGA